MPLEPSSTRRIFLRGALSALAFSSSALPLFAPAVASAHPVERRLSFHHMHTGERLKITYFADGRYLDDGLRTIDHFLRDWRTGEVVPIDPGLLDVVHTLCRKLEAERPVEVLCGYRSPKTNEMLRRRSRGVAKNSLHLHGRAIDLFVPGRDLARVRDAARHLRAGGVGYYPRSGFVHLDTGKVRYW